MTKTSSYRLDSYGPPGEPEPPEGGIFLVSESSWHLVFEPPRAGVSCGLLRSRVEVEATRRRRRCRVSVADEDGGTGFEVTFVLRARPERVRDDLRRRHVSLERSAEVVAAVAGGQWWRGGDAFDELGWSRTRSVAGVRCMGGDWEPDGFGLTRRPRVLDFGPDGVSLRGWRTRLRIPWERIAKIQVADADTYSDALPNEDRVLTVRRGGTVIVLTSHLGERITFHTTLATPGEVRAELGAPIDRLLRGLEEDPPMFSPGSVPVGPVALPDGGR